MKIGSPFPAVLGVLLMYWGLFSRAVLALDYCPELNLLITSMQIDGTQITVCADYNEIPGSYQGQSFTFPYTRWVWSLDGSDYTPNTGTGACAMYTNPNGDIGDITFRLTCRGRLWPHCNAVYSISTNIVVDIEGDGGVGQQIGMKNHCHDDEAVSLELTDDSHSENGFVWRRAPPGMSDTGRAFFYDPSRMMPGAYTVRVESADLAACFDECEINIVKVDIVQDELAVCAEDPLATLNLTSDSYSPNGFHWSSLPPGISGSSQDKMLTFIPSNLPPGKYTISARSVDLENCFDVCVVDVLKIGLVPDWNHDRAITSADENRATASNPYRFWINDDDDDGNEASGDRDIPGQYGGNYADDEVNGRCDLPDFFPVWLDLHDTLNLLPPSGTIQYKLKQASGAVRAVYTDLTKGSAGDYLTTAGNTYGPTFSQNSYGAGTFQITSSGVTISTDFLDKIKNDAAKGLLMIEGVAATASPLVLEIWKDGAKICEKEMPLRVDGVEKMYRWVNLRHVTGGSETRATDTNEPSNYPDSLCNGKHVVFVHGFNSSENGARAWNAEVFKRLYQSGSRAMYTAVTWEGDETPGILPPGAYYHADVINAFQAAPALASQVAALPGQKYVAAHSLGNMVASSAIVDHGLNPSRYFMIDAAVAMEAYKSTEHHYTDMAVPPWPDYTNRVWASEWYDLFDDPDGRYYLTWRGRFGNISQAINYYSSGEDVLNNNEAGGSVSIFDAPDKVWIFQERVKGGIIPAILVGVDSQGGWEFNGDYTTGVYDPSNDVYVTATTPAEAALLPESMLRAHSFFKKFFDEDIYGTNGSAVAADADVRGKVLAEGVPATSRAMGRNRLDEWGDSRNADLMTLNTGWPRSNQNWLHSDFKSVAFPYVYQFFEDMVAEGGLQ